MKFIKLTNEAGDPVWINFELVTFFAYYKSKQMTVVQHSDTEYEIVKESPEVIVRLLK